MPLKYMVLHFVSDGLDTFPQKIVTSIVNNNCGFLFLLLLYEKKKKNREIQAYGGGH